VTEGVRGWWCVVGQANGTGIQGCRFNESLNDVDKVERNVSFNLSIWDRMVSLDSQNLQFQKLEPVTPSQSQDEKLKLPPGCSYSRLNVHWFFWSGISTMFLQEGTLYYGYV
jgi:hypothetical protein